MGGGGRAWTETDLAQEWDKWRTLVLMNLRFP